MGRSTNEKVWLFTMTKCNQPQGVTMSIRRITLPELLKRSNKSSQSTLMQISGLRKMYSLDFVTHSRG